MSYWTYVIMVDLVSVAAWLLVALAGTLFVGHVSSVLLSALSLLGRPSPARAATVPGAVTVMRPVSGLEAYSEETLRSTFLLRADTVRIVFCVAHHNDPVVPLVQRLIAGHSKHHAKLLIGDERVSANPKLNNLVKAWSHLDTEWVAWIDSNVLLGPNALEEMFVRHDEHTGMVCSPPIGARADNAWADLEAVFLNGYQARWQLAASQSGLGFAQGKLMFFHRSLLDRAGGLAALAGEPAEDAAASKLIHGQGKTVRVVAQPFFQLLGRRTFMQVWNRQLRWAKLRRATFPYLFLPEILTGGLLPAAALVVGLLSLEIAVLPIIGIYLSAWYGLEFVLCRYAGWPTSWRFVPHSLLRDALLPALWVGALTSNTFEWQGHTMRVDETNLNDASRPV
jgi:ceramide glucosyltransferase